MAVTAVTTSMAGAINYTFTTDTSGDFASVANSTYFYNKADKLVRYKDSTGAVLEIFSASGGASGIFGIANTSGVYTYYATPALAYAAATAGQTIEMFADYTSSGIEELAITKNVNWNGNGHTWTKSATGTTHIITCALANCDFRMTGLNLIRTNGTSSDVYTATCFVSISPATGKIDMDGCFFENRNTGSAVALCMGSSTLEITGVTCKSVNTSAFISPNNIVSNCYFSGVTGIDMRGIANFCYAQGTTGIGFFAQNGTSSNCVGVSASGAGFYATYGNMYNCIGRSTTESGFVANQCNDVIDCVGISTSGYGFYANACGKNVTGNTGISSSSYGFRFQTPHCFNQTAITTSGIAIFDTASSGKLYNASIISSWNNAGGYGINGNGSLPVSIINCQFQLANSSAPYIYVGGTAAVIKMRGNTYEGGAAFNANITQGIVNTEDNQGNIYL